jgi:hypothetical protein
MRKPEYVLRMASAANPRVFQMPGHAWSMVKRIVRAYGAAQNDENSNVESVAKLAGIHRPIVSANNNFLRSIGILDSEKNKLTPLGVMLATGLGLENTALITEALRDAILSTPILAQVVNMLRARGPMEIVGFRGQIILAAGLNESSPNLPMVKTLIDMLEESGLIEIRDDRVFLVIRQTIQDNSSMPAAIVDPPRGGPQTQPTESDIGKGQQHQNRGDLNAWADKLLSKFPEFDPGWTDDVKLKWFDAFDRLMKGRGM